MRNQKAPQTVKDHRCGSIHLGPYPVRRGNRINYRGVIKVIAPNSPEWRRLQRENDHLPSIGAYRHNGVFINRIITWGDWEQVSDIIESIVENTNYRTEKNNA